MYPPASTAKINVQAVRRSIRVRFSILATDLCYVSFCAALASFVTWSTFGGGVPSLRHDWHSPLVPGALLPWLQSLFSPWLSTGIGQPQPYPTFYLVGLPLYALHGLLDTKDVLIAIVAGSIFLSASAGIRVGRQLGGNATALIPGAIAALNPWVYSKLVAGHIFMVLAYAFALALFCEVTRRRPRVAIVVLLAALCITQIEFCLIIAPALAYWCWRARQPLPLLAMLVASAPIAIGIIGRYGTLAQTEYTLPWQAAQSVPPLSGIMMLGYTFHYANGFDDVRPVLILLAVFACTGIVLLRKTGAFAFIGILAAVTIVYASGTTWWFSVPYVWLVRHVRESGVFRELYDLIAIVAVAYVAGMAALLGRHRKPLATTAAGLCAAALLVPWITHPVANYFVPANAFPAAQFPPDPQHRVALFPAYQPIAFDQRGSGYDPDLFEQQAASSPVNEFFPTYPVDAALSYAWFDKDFTLLRALSVSQIINRPYFETNWDSLRYQQALLQPIWKGLPNDKLSRAPSIVSLTYGTPVKTEEPQDLLSNVVFDDTDVIALRNEGAEDFAVDRHWIDSRLAELTHPEWSTPQAGVVTRSTVGFQIPRGSHSLLASVNGYLITPPHRVLAHDLRRLTWISLPSNSRSVRCLGTCMLSLVSTRHVTVRPSPPPAAWHDANARMDAPWSFSVRLGYAASARTLRFGESYGSYWAAYINGQELRHVKLNGVFNAWIVPAGTSGSVILVERLSSLQMTFERVALISIVIIAIFSLFLTRRHELQT